MPLAHAVDGDLHRIDFQCLKAFCHLFGDEIAVGDHSCRITDAHVEESAGQALYALESEQRLAAEPCDAQVRHAVVPADEVHYGLFRIVGHEHLRLIFLEAVRACEITCKCRIDRHRQTCFVKPSVHHVEFHLPDLILVVHVDRFDLAQHIKQVLVGIRIDLVALNHVSQSVGHFVRQLYERI